MSKKVITVTKEFTFEAAHNLPNHKGACRRMHGHSYKMQVTVKRIGEPLLKGGSSDGMVIDFTDLKNTVQVHIIEKLDHEMLNDVFQFRPTAENMVEWAANVLEPKLLLTDIQLVSIKLWETAGAYAEVVIHE